MCYVWGNGGEICDYSESHVYAYPADIYSVECSVELLQKVVHKARVPLRIDHTEEAVG